MMCLKIITEKNEIVHVFIKRTHLTFKMEKVSEPLKLVID